MTSLVKFVCLTAMLAKIASAGLTSCSITDTRTGRVVVSSEVSANCSTGVPNSGVFIDEFAVLNAFSGGDTLFLSVAGFLGITVGTRVTGNPEDYECTEESCDPFRVVSSANLTRSRRLRAVFTNDSGSGYIQVARDDAGGDYDGTGGSAQGSVGIRLQQGSTVLETPVAARLSLKEPIDITMNIDLAVQQDTRLLGSYFYRQLWFDLMLSGRSDTGEPDPTARLVALTEVPEPSTFGISAIGLLLCALVRRTVLAPAWSRTAHFVHAAQPRSR
jgi:hypothetical protein